MTVPEPHGSLGNGPSAKTRAEPAEKDDRQRAAAYAENIWTGRVSSENFAHGSFQARGGESHRSEKRKKKGRKAKEQEELSQETYQQTQKGELQRQPFQVAFLTDMHAREHLQHV